MTTSLDSREKELAQREKALDDRIKKIEEAQKSLEKDTATKLAHGGQVPSYQTTGNRSSSMEQKALQSFGVRDPRGLLNLNVHSRRFVGVDPVYKQMVLSLKETIDTARFISQIFYERNFDIVGVDEKSDKSAHLKTILEHNFGREVLAPMLKAFGTGVAGEGAEWIPTAVSSQFIEEFELEKRVATAFREMPMPTNPFKLSVQDSVSTARIATEGSSLSGASFGTDTIDFDAVKLGEFYPLPEELNEDSAPAILQIARSEVAEAQIRARETAILNGDDSGTHQDNDTDGGAADLAEKAWKGLRKLALDNSPDAVVTFSSAVTTAKLDEMRTAAGKFGINVRDLAYIFSPTTYHQAVNLDEVTSVEKFGSQATILSGALAAFRGVPVMISEFVREDVAATGVNTAAGPNTKGLVYLVNMKRFWLGMRRPIRVRVMMDLANQDRWLLSSYSRVDFKGHAQSSSEVSAVIGIDVTI